MSLRAVARQSLSVDEIQEIAALPLAMTVLFFQAEFMPSYPGDD